MNRGEVWRLHTVAGQRPVLVVGNVADSPEIRAYPIAVDIGDPNEAPESLLNIPIQQPIEGVILTSRIGKYRAAAFEAHLGAVDPTTMEAVESALRAALDL